MLSDFALNTSNCGEEFGLRRDTEGTEMTQSTRRKNVFVVHSRELIR